MLWIKANDFYFLWILYVVPLTDEKRGPQGPGPKRKMTPTHTSLAEIGGDLPCTYVTVVETWNRELAPEDELCVYSDKQL